MFQHSEQISRLTGQPQNKDFAIKRLYSQDEGAFRDEVKALKKFSNNAHPHVISLLATYKYQGSYYLIFPWADGGDLYCFWEERMPKPPFDDMVEYSKICTWVAKQCKGIASGLMKIHKHESSNGFHAIRYGTHGDLTPMNILWFQDADGGVLKIADFGHSKYSDSYSKTYRSKSGVATTMSYRAPEHDVGRLGQSADIWTLACIYLEFITWLLGGNELVQDFRTRRQARDRMYYMDSQTFFELAESANADGQIILTAKVKTVVKEVRTSHHVCTNKSPPVYLCSTRVD